MHPVWGLAVWEKYSSGIAGDWRERVKSDTQTSRCLWNIWVRWGKAAPRLGSQVSMLRQEPHTLSLREACPWDGHWTCHLSKGRWTPSLCSPGVAAHDYFFSEEPDDVFGLCLQALLYGNYIYQSHLVLEDALKRDSQERRASEVTEDWG